MFTTKGSWSPNVDTALWSFLTVRVLSGILNINFISECDEVMNYWEPTHYLLYGKGLQTWEYSPEYGIRTYAYIGLHATVGYVFKIFGAEKPTVFYGIRLFLGVVCAMCELFFYTSIRKRFHPQTALFTFLFLLCTPGMWIAGTAYIPSSMCMYAMMVAFGAWITNRFAVAVASVAFAALFPGWPFPVIMAIPLALDAIRQRGFIKVFKWALISLILILGPTVAVDYVLYRKFTLPVLNIFLYNVLQSNGGPELYGVQRWTYYVQNLFLNFNFVAVLGLMSLPIALCFLFKEPRSSVLSFCVYLTPIYIWMALMLKMPHKEERFLFVIYPLLCFGGAFALVASIDWIFNFFASYLVANRRAKLRTLNKFMLTFQWLGALVIVLISLSRIISLHINYVAPVQIFSHLYDTENGQQSGNVRVCIGKEWYRFPSNFFLPSHCESAFIKSDFRGQLPKPYSEEDGTWGIPAYMNDQNREEPTRYVNESTCDYLVDLDLENQKETHYSQHPNWKIVAAYPFLDAENSPRSVYRAFYIPFLSSRHNSFVMYYLLKQNKSK